MDAVMLQQLCGLTDYRDTDRKYTSHFIPPLIRAGLCVIYQDTSQYQPRLCESDREEEDWTCCLLTVDGEDWCVCACVCVVCVCTIT